MSASEANLIVIVEVAATGVYSETLTREEVKPALTNDAFRLGVHTAPHSC